LVQLERSVRYIKEKIRMKRIISLVITGSALTLSSVALGQAPPPPPQPPVGSIDEVNSMILIDVSGSMADLHTASQTKLKTALERAKDKVLAWDAADAGKPKEYALWAFDSSFGAGNGWVVHVRDFPSTKAQVLESLGYSSTGTPLSAGPNIVFTPTSSTPLAGAGCLAGGYLVASVDANGADISPQTGYEWKKEKSPGVRAQIKRQLYIGTDGLENDTPTSGTGSECGGVTSNAAYENFEPASWQYKLRNKLLTGNPTINTTLNSLLTVDVDLIFKSYITGLSGGNSERNYSSGSPYSTEPTLNQAVEFYGGLAQNTLAGKFKTVTVDASGAITSRRPGDVDYSGCVGNADYSELIQWYGQAVSPSHPHSYWADLNGDGWVDYLDYLILYNHWGDGGVC
jgi:hypothetical protein